MDDTCAVCAESLEWLGYGACGHKDVCSTCVARLRFICDDRRCCICKTESDVVFMTKAMGDYTKTISDFSLLPSGVREGRVGQYWYHEDTQAFFDDFDHYKMIKAMCKLSCSVCDKMEEQPCDTTKRPRIKSIEQLKGHLFHKHKLLMCNLCLESRKVFVCEQKLYTRAQLTRHINFGDSEADGPESERDGFTGHPMCEFCRTPLYGDNELYMHMSTEHFTCHMCQRRNPGQYEYYKNYDDLEMHFRRDHFLCEDEGCLVKKFIVFPSEAELKRHNTLEHGGNMSRSKRSAALQIPTSFRYRRSNEQENRRERGRIFEPDHSVSELSLAIEASLQTDSSTASNNQSNINLGEAAVVESQFPPLESSAPIVSEKSSRYLQAVSHSSGVGQLRESSFPPLSAASGSSNPNSHANVPPVKNMAAHLRRKNNGKVSVLVSSGRPSGSRAPAELVAGRDAWPSINGVSGSGQNTGASSQSRPPSASYSSISASSSSSSRASDVTRSIVHSSSAPNLSGYESVEASSTTDFPPVSTAHPRKAPIIHQTLTKVEDVHSANKLLVEKMRAALGNDEDKFTVFRDISGAYRLGTMDAKTYVEYVDQFGLSHLVIELARLLPDPEKQKELIEAYNTSLIYNVPKEIASSIGSKDARVSKKGKGKAVDLSSSSTNTISPVAQLQSRYRDSEEEVEVLSKDGYRPAQGKSKIVASDPGLIASSEGSKPLSQTEAASVAGGANQSSNVDGKGKQRKKSSKFHRVRLGDGSAEAVLDLNKADLDPPSDASSANSVEGSANHGVWRNGGGQKLVAAVSRRSKN